MMMMRQNQGGYGILRSMRDENEIGESNARLLSAFQKLKVVTAVSCMCHVSSPWVLPSTTQYALFTNNMPHKRGRLFMVFKNATAASVCPQQQSVPSSHHIP